MAKLISWYQPDWACISLAEDKTKGRKTHKQTTTELKSKGLEKQFLLQLRCLFLDQHLLLDLKQHS